MPKVIDEIGNVHGRLTVLSVAHLKPRKAWVCLCECGTTKTVEGVKLRNGHTKSCGCLAREQVGKKHPSYKHGQSATLGSKKASTTYSSWASMVARCNNPKSTSYLYYGAVGVKVCQRWETFTSFLEDMGEAPEGKTLDRIDNSLGYIPGNCRWATKREQSLNRKHIKMYEYKGQTKALSEWAEELDIKYIQLYKLVRIENFAFEDAVLAIQEFKLSGRDRMERKPTTNYPKADKITRYFTKDM